MTLTKASQRAGSGSLSLLFCICVFLVAFATNAGAEQISYPGARLRTDPATHKQSLYPNAASGNTVTLGSGIVPGVVVGSGAVMKNVSSSNNTVRIKGGTVKSGVFGTIAQKKASYSTVYVTGRASIGEGVYGGMSLYSNAVSNRVFLNRGTVKGVAVGGASENKTAGNNAVTIAGATVKGLVAGGYTAGSANSNVVTVKKGIVTEGLAGGTGDSAAQKNVVKISGGRVSGSIAGGSSNKYALKNKVRIADVTLKASAAGGVTWQPNASYGAVGNELYITRSTVNAIPKKKVSAKSPRLVAGGAALGGSPASKNTLTLSSAIIGSSLPVAGGYALGSYASTAVSGNKLTAKRSTLKSKVYGGYSKSGNTSLNSVSISGGSSTGNIYGGCSGDYADRNKVEIASGTHSGQIYGGLSDNSYSSGNSVKITGGTFSKNVFGGYAQKSGASTNSVSISGGKFTGSVYGGAANRYAKDNRVNISGGSFYGSIIGGKANLEAGITYSDPHAAASSNTITLSGAPKLTNAAIYGSRIYNEGTRSYLPDLNKSNTLVVKGFRGTVKGLYNIGTYKFQLPQNVANKSTIIRSAARVALDNANVTLTGFASGAKALAPGNVVTLIGNTNGASVKFRGTNVKRGVEVYDFSLVSDSANLKARVDSVRVSPSVRVITKARAETLDLITRGADRVAEQTMAAVRLNAASSALGGGGLFMFGDTSSAVPGAFWGSEGKISSSLAGLGFSSATNHGTLALGSFFESGWTDRHAQDGATFDSASLRDRDQSSYGSGFLARFDHTSGLYAEGALRYGKAQNNFTSNNLRDGFGNKAAYDVGTNYTSFHTGLGKVFAVNESLSLESYSKLFVTRLEGDNTTVLGDKLRLRDSESRRIRSGAKFSFDLDERLTAFAGLAHEYEADGKVRAQVAGYNLERKGAKGHSAMFQAGFSFKPVKDSPVSLYVDYRGYAGARKDSNASAGLQVEF